MATPTESSILSDLQTAGDSKTIHSLVSDYLRPISTLANSKKKKHDEAAVRSLAKRFLSFLSKSFPIIYKRIYIQNPNEQQQASLSDFFETYRLCITCLEFVSSQLAGGAHLVQIQRLKLVYCLHYWGRYDDGESEALRVLERLRGETKSKGKIVPGIDVAGGDSKFGSIVVEAVASVVKNVALGHSKDSRKYERVLALVEQVRPWCRALESDVVEKSHNVLVTFLGRCCRFLVEEINHFGEELVRLFCSECLTEYARSMMKDQVYKFARRISSSLFSLDRTNSSVQIGLVTFLLLSISRECKVDIDNNAIEFVELVDYCAYKCRAVGTTFCSTLVKHLNDIAGDFCQATVPVDLILRLYATALDFAEHNVKLKYDNYTTSKGAENASAIDILFLERDKLHTLSALGERKAYLVMYYNTLKFLCQPLAELVNAEKKRILSETEASSDSRNLCIIRDAFDQFCDSFFSLERCTSETKREGFDDDEVLVPSIIVAGFIVSIGTKCNIRESVCYIKQIIGSSWIQSQGLKYVYISLYNIGVLMYRNKQIKEALKALKLSHRASWTHIQLLREMFTQKKSFDDHLSEDAIRDLVSDACSRTAFLSEVLHACGNLKAERIIVESLKNWSTLENLFRQLSGPMPLIKQWVKIQCKLRKNMNLEDNAPTLCCMLLSSGEVSKRAIGKILEQELLAYQEMTHGYPDFCHRMQTKVIDLLMQDDYAIEDNPLQRARILIRKGRTLRANGIEALKDCICCLSKAISIMNRETRNAGTPACHQLAAAYCLLALCTQEAEPNSEQVYPDICAALDLWSSIFIPDSCFTGDEFKMVSGSTLQLLYNILDLLSVKGYTTLHSNIYKLIMRIYKLNNVELGKCAANLWECRRLSHALCVSPVNESFITNLSEQCGETSKAVDFWIQCLSGSQPGLIGFQQNVTCFFNNFTNGLKNDESNVQSAVSANNVNLVVSELTASDPVRSHSLFLAGYLYYDLCERHISSGQLFEGLSYAKEAFRLRSQLFKRKFTFSIEEHVGKGCESGDIDDIAQKAIIGPKNLQVHRIVASEIWSFDSSSSNLCGSYLSPWNVLQCYLESILQVGCINEMAGNGVEAESFLLWGKSISCSQSLPLFEAMFSSILGKLYRKKQLWNFAEQELQSAKRLMVDRNSNYSCTRCRLMLEVNLDLQLGDLIRNLSDSDIINDSKERFSHAEVMYKSALEKLNHSAWKNIITDEESKEDLVIRTTIISGEDVACNAASQPDAIDARKGRKTKKVSKPAVKEQRVIPEQSSRVTRSRYRSSQNQSISSTGEAQVGLSKQSNGNVVSKVSDTCWEKESSLLGKESCMDESTSEIACICKRAKLWQCLPAEIMKSGLLIYFINMKWEYARRKLLVRILTGIGKCLGSHDQTREIHKVVWQSISVLVSRNAYTQTCSSACGTFLLDLIGREIIGDTFAVERAAILYSIGWMTVKSFHSKGSRIVCCGLSEVPLSKIVHWLKLAFVLSREVPVLFKKVSRLLSAIYLLSATNEHFTLPSCKAPSESQWASYFHQASLGTHLNNQFFPNTSGRSITQRFVDPGDLHATGSSCPHTETSTLLRLAPESVNDLEQFALSFFEGLPSTAIICISLLGHAYTSLLQELLLYPSSIHAWMLLSRLNSENQPIVLLLPLDSVFEEVSEDAAPNDENAKACQELRQRMKSGKKWHCPWGSTVVDNVAPGFKVILEENFVTSSGCPLEDTKSTRSLWWMIRKKVDHQLGKLLSNLEDSWLGPWKHVLLGDCLDCESLNTVHKKLARDLKSKCQMSISESYLKLVLGAAKSDIEEACLSKQCLQKGCYIGAAKSNGIDSVSALASRLIRKAANELHWEDTISREPIILVLDLDVQMLPWESIPILRQQEVYRMPSVGSISMILRRYDELVGRNAAAVPLIDPLDAFYLLNPSGDLRSTQAEFENWFRDQNFEGKAGTVPTAEELATALKNHDLYLYFGHGSGEQYISKDEIQGLEKCAATVLMGCSSGSLRLNGCYVPRGVSLSYIQAGSPVTIANLWEVTDKDIDRFGKAVLNAWLRERMDQTDCSKCSQLVKEIGAMDIREGRKGNSKKKVASSNSVETTNNGSSSNVCEHRPTIGSFVGMARDTCTLPFLNGAAPVCYGVPTGITRKKPLLTM
ncbi:EXTRA SPINDLE POLES, RADIALLY SWOLLEN 4, homolog of separase, HOMOLOGY OF SEPARASE 1 [Hibiscus trionum]|uniref:separase n=1 Tax=Hibiscus trionum TaxID=183268 RepID=A0A9W7I303_HIBTR|nr:EXTRA SPINDLE POLES, RADIALLY SWOLLEN 4, homolog of separase, HOMOLOGY OF SEPARASE 1 [Hibiscus trionum]